MEKTIEIPEGYEARIEGNKVILESKDIEDEKIRKAIRTLILSCSKEQVAIIGICQSKMLAWLEKQKPVEWSEEDESILRYIKCNLEYIRDHDKAYQDCEDKHLLRKQIDWLKSLKERYTWKPSDEQMEALGQAVQYHVFANTKRKEAFVELFNDLKKLTK